MIEAHEIRDPVQRHESQVRDPVMPVALSIIGDGVVGWTIAADPVLLVQELFARVATLNGPNLTLSNGVRLEIGGRH